jgi:hypothetical protein
MKICHDHLQYAGQQLKDLILNDHMLDKCERQLFPTHPRLKGSILIKNKWEKVNVIEST